jgi:hypothetical protein
MRRLIALAAVFLSGLAVAACSDRENAQKGNKGDAVGTTGLTANPSTLQGTGAETDTTNAP